MPRAPAGLFLGRWNLCATFKFFRETIHTANAVQGSVACDKGAFGFTATGSWGKNGFHGAGVISEDGRSGEFAQAIGRVVMIDGTVVPAATAGTYDAAYELIVERTDK